MHERRLRLRFLIDAGLGTISGVLVVTTVVWHDWAEAIFGYEPDGGNGSFEVGTTLVAMALTLTFALLARLDWRRAGYSPLW